MAILITPGVDLVKRLNLAAADEGGKIKVYTKNGVLTAGVRIDYPPYNCVTTGLNTKVVENFASAWQGCSSLTSFPLLNVSSGIIFNFAWQGCHSLTSFPLLNVSSGVIFAATWANCSSLTSFPLLSFTSAINFYRAWYYCSNLTTFPAGVFDACPATNFTSAWQGCALSQQSVDNILISIDNAGQLNGTLGISGGTSSPPSSTGLAAKASLISKGWTVTTN